MLNLAISFPGKCAFWGKSLQFWGDIYYLDGYFGLFPFTKTSENLYKFHIFSALATRLDKYCYWDNTVVLQNIVTSIGHGWHLKRNVT